MSMQEDLQYLLREGWRLIDVNTVQSPDGEIITDNINSAARAWRAKRQAQAMIQAHEEEKRKEEEKKKKWTYRLLSLFW